MAPIIHEYELSTPPTSISLHAKDCDDVWQGEDVADQGSRLLLAIAMDLSLDDMVLDLEDYIN